MRQYLGPIEFMDGFGLLDKKTGPDGGDTGQREGMYWSLYGMIRDHNKKAEVVKWTRPITFDEVYKQINPHPSVILRHSNPEWDASDWDRMSRDQLQPNIIAMGYNDHKRLKDLRTAHMKRGFIFTSNTRKNGATKKNHGQLVAGEVRDYSWKLPDFTGPEIWANFVRSGKDWEWYPFLFGLWPILIVLYFTHPDFWGVVSDWWGLFPFFIPWDLELLGGAIKWRWFRGDDNITMNQTTSMMQGWDRMRTPWTWLAVKIMPIEMMIELMVDHFDDFDNQSTPQPEDMEWFGTMFKDAWEAIK